MTRDKENPLTTVTPASKQVKEARSRWNWVEPSVWTERMLTALETGVKGEQWFSLIDKVWRPANLRAAYQKVKANGGSPGVDNISIARFGRELDKELEQLGRQLQGGQYSPRSIRRVYIPKAGGGQRPLGIPTVRDRVMQGAVRQVIEPIFEKTFAPCSYGFRPGRGAKDALREVNRLLQEGYHHVVDVDIKGYFDNIPHEPLIEQFLRQPIRENEQEVKVTCGTPQGGLISPLLANIYLNPLDHLLVQQGYQIIRYADDMVILCREHQEAQAALRVIQDWMRAAQLQLHPEKTRLVNMSEPDAYFDFLGYRFKRNRRTNTIDRWPRPKSMQKLREHLRPNLGRCNGFSLTSIIARINPTLRGWYVYFKHARPKAMEAVDGWVRMRLRSILRKRRGLKGRGRGRDHHRWPNAFFAEQGLFSLTAAHVQECQSVHR
jgi:RNA-directed DNA polymerase